MSTSTKEYFQKNAPDLQRFGAALDSDCMTLAVTTTMAIMASEANVGRREMDGARRALQILGSLHLKDPPHKSTLASPLRHDFDNKDAQKQKQKE